MQIMDSHLHVIHSANNGFTPSCNISNLQIMNSHTPTCNISNLQIIEFTPSCNISNPKVWIHYLQIGYITWRCESLFADWIYYMKVWIHYLQIGYITQRCESIICILDILHEGVNPLFAEWITCRCESIICRLDILHEGVNPLFADWIYYMKVWIHYLQIGYITCK